MLQIQVYLYEKLQSGGHFLEMISRRLGSNRKLREVYVICLVGCNVQIKGNKPIRWKGTITFMASFGAISWQPGTES